MQKLIKLPSISVVMPTYDGSGSILDKCLSLIRQQNYPQGKIEIVLGDGGTQNTTVQIAKKYKARVIKIPPHKQHAEYNRGMAFKHAKNDLVLILDSDNFLPYKKWLRDMVEPLLKHQDVVAVETCFYAYNSADSLLDRYFALLGCSEPLPYYLGKADRMPWGTDHWVLRGKAIDKGNYYLVDLPIEAHEFPTVGSNACLMRRKIVSKYADVRPSHHYPIDVMLDVAQAGFNKFAFIKKSIIHHTGYKGFWAFLRRRYLFVNQYHFNELNKRRYSVYAPEDFWRVVWYVFISLTIVKPAWDALQGFRRHPDIAWIVHPFMAFTTTIIYGFMIFKNMLMKDFRNMEIQI